MIAAVSNHSRIHYQIVQNGLELVGAEVADATHLRGEMEESVHHRQRDFTYIALDPDHFVPQRFQASGDMRADKSPVACNSDLDSEILLTFTCGDCAPADGTPGSGRLVLSERISAIFVCSAYRHRSLILG